MSMPDVKTGWEPEARRVPPGRQPRQSDATPVLLAVLGCLQVVTLVFLLVWEVRYQRAMDAVENIKEQIEAYEL